VLSIGPSTGSVGLAVIAAVLAAAVLHAVWNALAHAIGDELVGFALIGTAVTGCAVGIVLGSSAPSRASWSFLAGSAVLHVAYNLLRPASSSEPLSAPWYFTNASAVGGWPPPSLSLPA
jgi:hypothetical protein